MSAAISCVNLSKIMDFNYSNKTSDLRMRLCAFMDEHIFPNEKIFVDEINAGDRWQPSELIEELKTKAKAIGLWNLFLPSESGLTNVEYAVLAEIMGRVVWASEVFNCSAPDTGNMEVLHLYGKIICFMFEMFTSITQHYIDEHCRYWLLSRWMYGLHSGSTIQCFH